MKGSTVGRPDATAVSQHRADDATCTNSKHKAYVVRRVGSAKQGDLVCQRVRDKNSKNGPLQCFRTNIARACDVISSGICCFYSDAGIGWRNSRGIYPAKSTYANVAFRCQNTNKPPRKRIAPINPNRLLRLAGAPKPKRPHGLDRLRLHAVIVDAVVARCTVQVHA